MKAFIAPIHLDAMLLPHHMMAREALANYTKLPYTNAIQDFNPETPYLGEAILNHPFQDKNLLLKPGVHLHWSLPRGLSKSVGIPIISKNDLEKLATLFPKKILTNNKSWKKVKDLIWSSMLISSNWIKPITTEKASILGMNTVDKKKFEAGIKRVIAAGELNDSSGEIFVKELMKLLTKPVGNDFPAVPNVWLIIKKNKTKIEQGWVVESNYISKTQSEDEGNIGSVNIPFHDDNSDNKTQPFRYMGRQKPFAPNWKLLQSDPKKYINEVTAIGYNPQAGSKGFAEPTFAAFYPNSLSVFGFFDPNPKDGRTYEVMGFYSNPEKDYFQTFIKDFYNRYPNNENFFSKLNEIIKVEFQWQMDDKSPIKKDSDLPDQTILFGKAIPKSITIPNPSQIDIAVGNTGTEALSAYLASKVSGDKNTNEEILESIQFASKLQNQVLDIGHKFEEARHDKGFTAFEGGTIWSLKLETISFQNKKDKSNAGEIAIHYPDEIAQLLNKVNELQFAFDKKLRVTPFLRQQLFSDWCKYMMSAYPSVDNTTFHFDNDEMMEYIRKYSIAPLKKNLAHVGTISIAKDEQGRFKDVIVIGEKNSLAEKLGKQLKQLVKKVNSFNNKKQTDGKSLKEKGKCIAIRQLTAPRYWRANDPVILFAEKPKSNQEALLNNDRYKKPTNSDPIICQISNITKTDFSKITATQLTKIHKTVSTLFSKKADTNIGQSDAIWNPFMLEWEVEFLPAIPGSNEATDDRKYDSGYINQHYQLKETDPDFSLTSKIDVFQNANIYTGSTILTPSSGIILDKVLDQFIKNHKDDQPAATLKSLNEAKSYLEKINVLSQSIGGFHDALVMQKQTRQLDVADPLGFPEYQSFSKNEVAPLVKKFNLTAPEPLSEYNPIRCGVMKILSLRMIDTFGQTLDFDTSYFAKNEVVTAETVNLDRVHSGFHLKPRLTQPARINFRFLAAKTDEQEMNDDPVSSPICGWLLPNHLDRSIMFYDQDGAALGALTLNASYPWSPAPGGGNNTNIGSINNPHLRRVANYLLDRQIKSIQQLGSSDDSFLLHFLNALDSASENVQPENFAEHQDLAVLIGRPLAVIRTKLHLELEHPPATDQSWTQLHHEISGHGRTTDDFTKVKFPIRLGEYKQLNDGLIGYWIENSDGSLQNNYYSSEANDNPDPFIKTFETKGEPLNIFHSLDDEPVCFTMLADPLGNIQAMSGILPIKSISIPSDQYKNALKKISITFLTAPILSPTNHLKISLPNESDFEWSFLEKSKEGAWGEISQTVIIEKSVLDSKFPDDATVWNQLVSKKWIEPLESNPERALITAATHRAFPPNQPSAFPPALGKRIDEFFDAYGKRIEPFDLQASFNGTQTIREGWLKLSNEK